MTMQRKHPYYEQHTRFHYQRPEVAADYASRQRFIASPSEWVIGARERALVVQGLHAVGAWPAPRVLDVPAGTGKLVGLLSGGADHYVACDISGPMLLHLPEGVACSRADAVRLPFAGRSFDTAVCLRLFHRVPHDLIEAIIRELVRVTKKGFVFSYAGSSAYPGLHSMLRRVGRRPLTATWPLRPADLQHLAQKCNTRVVFDGSISWGITEERVAAVVRN